MSAKGQGPPPPLLQLAFWCGSQHLPDVGGMLDQDYKTMRHMMAVKNAYETVDYARGLVGKDIHTKLSPGQKKTIGYLRSEGLM